MGLITAYLIFLYVMTFVFLLLFILQMLKRNSLSILFATFSLVNAVYMFGVAGQIRSYSYIDIIFYQKLKYMGAPYLAPVFLLFLYRFKNFKLPSGKIVVSTLVIPIITTFLVTTNETHWLYYSSSSLVYIDGYSLLITERGPLYFLSLYNYVIFGFIIYYMVKLIKQKNNRLNYFLISIIFGLVSVVIFNILYILRLVPLGLDLVPLTTLIQVVSFYIAIFKLKIFDLNEAELEIVPKLTEGIIFFDDDNNLIHYNLAAKKIFPFLSHDNIGKKIDKIEELIEEFYEDLNEFIVKVNDKVFKINVSYEYGKTFIINDYTVQYESQKKLKWIGEHDGLTKVYNQVYALKKIEEQYNRSIKCSHEFNIVMMDVNNFKDINDKYGHLIGNKVLVEIGSRLIDVYGVNKDIMYGRFGGDEFIIGFNKISKDEVVILTRKLINEINKIIIDNLEELKINVSIGLANRDEIRNLDNCDFMDIIDKADAAMYKSKKLGDNFITIY